MTEVNFYEFSKVDNNKLKFAVIVSKYNTQWIFVKHKSRETWEIPGGRREESEVIFATAERELYEETGAIDFNITPICVYSVKQNETKTFGGLFYAEILKIGPLPPFEIDKINFFDKIPNNLTYPFIQNDLFRRVLKFEKEK